MLPRNLAREERAQRGSQTTWVRFGSAWTADGRSIDHSVLGGSAKIPNTFEPTDDLPARHFCLHRIKLSKTERAPAAVEPLAGSDASPYLADPVDTLLKTDAELGSLGEVPLPYTDPLLHQPSVYRRLVILIISKSMVEISFV